MKSDPVIYIEVDEIDEIEHEGLGELASAILDRDRYLPETLRHRDEVCPACGEPINALPELSDAMERERRERQKYGERLPEGQRQSVREFGE